MGVSLLRRLQAHPATERVLTPDDVNVIATALHRYANDMAAEAKSIETNSSRIYAATVRKATSEMWRDRSVRAMGIYDDIYPSGEFRAVSVVLRW